MYLLAIKTHNKSLVCDTRKNAPRAPQLNRYGAMELMTRALHLFCIATLISGCVGDSAVKVHGIAPQNGECEIRLVNAKDGVVVDSAKVNGEFTDTFIWGGRLSRLTIVGECDGEITQTLKEWRMPNQFSEAVEIGDISP